MKQNTHHKTNQTCVLTVAFSPLQTCYALVASQENVKWRDLWWVLVVIAIFIFICVIILIITVHILYDRYKSYMDTQRTCKWRQCQLQVCAVCGHQRMTTTLWLTFFNMLFCVQLQVHMMFACFLPCHVYGPYMVMREIFTVLLCVIIVQKKLSWGKTNHHGAGL